MPRRMVSGSFHGNMKVSICLHEVDTPGRKNKHSLLVFPDGTWCLGRLALGERLVYSCHFCSVHFGKYRPLKVMKSQVQLFFFWRQDR